MGGAWAVNIMPQLWLELRSLDFGSHVLCVAGPYCILAAWQDFLP